MAKIFVQWQRKINIRPYESETITLGVEEELGLDTVTATKEAVEKRGRTLATAKKILFEALVDLGDQIVEQRLNAPDPRDQPQQEKGRAVEDGDEIPF